MPRFKVKHSYPVWHTLEYEVEFPGNLEEFTDEWSWGNIPIPETAYDNETSGDSVEHVDHEVKFEEIED